MTVEPIEPCTAYRSWEVFFVWWLRKFNSSRVQVTNVAGNGFRVPPNVFSDGSKQHIVFIMASMTARSSDDSKDAWGMLAVFEWPFIYSDDLHYPRRK